MTWKSALAAGAAIAGLALPIQASVVSFTGSGGLAGSAAGISLSRSSAISPLIQAYDESVGVTVADGAVTVDYLAGTNIISGGAAVGGVDSHSSSGALSLSAGTYDSHLLRFAPGGNASGLNATFTFSGAIVGLILSNTGSANLLDLSDDVFGNASAYRSGSGRRVESGESIQLTSANTLRLISWVVGGTQTDELRVITAPSLTAVPIPAALPLLLAGFGALGMVRRRRRRNRQS